MPKKVNIRAIDKELCELEGGAVNLPIGQVSEVRRKFSLMISSWSIEELGAYLAQVRENEKKNQPRPSRSVA